MLDQSIHVWTMNVAVISLSIGHHAYTLRLKAVY